MQTDARCPIKKQSTLTHPKFPNDQSMNGLTGVDENQPILGRREKPVSLVSICSESADSRRFVIVGEG